MQMKHLKIQSGAPSLESIDDFQPTIAMEGLKESMREKFNALKAKISGDPKEAEKQLTLNDVAIKEFRNVLVSYKSDLSSSKYENTKSINIATHLNKMGVSAKTPQDAIAAMRKHNVDLRKLISEAGKLSKEAPKVIKDGTPEQQKAFAEKAEALKKKLKEKPEPGDSVKDMVFNKKQMLELTDCFIDYCDLYFEARKKENLIENLKTVEKIDQQVPKMESRRDGGFIDSIFEIIKEIIVTIFYVIVWLLFIKIAVFIAVANPTVFLVGTLTLIFMYVFRGH